MTTNIPWGPIIGVILVIVGVAGIAFGIVPNTDAFTILTVGLGVLGIHSSVNQAAGRIAKGY